MHIRRNPVHSGIMVYQEGARPAHRILHRQWSSWWHVWWLPPKWHPFVYERPAWPARLEMAIHCEFKTNAYVCLPKLADCAQISGIITLPVAVYGYFFFPDTPHTTTAFYLSQEEIALARERVPIHEVDKMESILSKSFLSRVVHSWYFYAFCFLWILGNCSESQSNQSLLSLYMQAHPTEKYNLYQRNNYPTGVQAMGVTSTLLWATSTDIWGRRWLSGYYVSFTAIANAAIILAPTSTAAKFGAYYWAGSIYCIQATFFAWANDSMRNESLRLRSCVIACMNAAGNCFQAWWPLIFYRADDAPEFKVCRKSLYLSRPET